MTRLTPKLLAAAVAVALPALSSASTLFTFDTNGAAAGGQVVLSNFDPAVGNALSVNGNPVGGLTTGSVNQLLYQANLFSGADATGDGSINIGNFTVVVGFQEVATVSTDAVANTATATFNLANPVTGPTANNFIYIYATGAPASNLAGTGFVSGTPILSGYISGVTAGSYTQSLNIANGGDCAVVGATVKPLDCFGNNDYPNKSTLTGSGTSNVSFVVTAVDKNYFPDFSTGLMGGLSILGDANTGLTDPFTTVNPSARFTSNGTTDANYAANIAPLNGFNGTANTNYDFIFQADGNLSFTANAVPEPGSLAMFGGLLGLLGVAARRRSSR